VHPRARRTALAGRLGDAWKLAIRRAAGGRQGLNEECVEFFAELARVPKSRVRIVSGATGRMKVVEVTGVGQEELEKLLRAGFGRASLVSRPG